MATGDWRYLAPEEYFAILADDEVCGEERAKELAYWVTMYDAVLSACFSPADSVDDRELFPTLCEKTAVLGWRLLDLGLDPYVWKGRGAYLAMLHFVQKNEGDFVDVDDTGALQTAVILDNVMARRMALAEFTQWVCAQVYPP